ncbi:hypothetical protein CRP171_gp12 [Roseobacter phage CRP-171]|jgi:hypothetical protein|uniref:Winged helix-turn-helix domain-containing protein n=2 Tax=Oceanidvirus TaxID=3425753 RepID=A0AAX3ZZQ3_9CAUD|nr:hypothetical protein CRP171_gp12 [Roseobacter phage CRP-171]WMM95829.1 hypothetical protein CRP113_gp12 [Roseobacter phage CRP-113]
MTQMDIVKKHLQKYGSISPLEAQSNYNIWRLAAVVGRLKDRGVSINMTMKRAPSGAKYAEYKLS